MYEGTTMRPLLALILPLAVFAAFAAWPAGSPQDADAGGCEQPQYMGDLDGSQDINSTDAIWVLRSVARLNLPDLACSPLDVDCSGAANSIDALKILRYIAGLGYSQVEPCTDIGSPFPL
jgi:hypothetical protein